MTFRERTARAIDLAVGERVGGPNFVGADARRLDRAALPPAKHLNNLGAGYCRPAPIHAKSRHAISPNPALSLTRSGLVCGRVA
ncbi:MAG TPA: hypothetical protein VN786_02300 [Acidimicrobiales bacterium]|nr:hypothetical protein [Acidimicrobiales bacterium]